MRATVAAGGAAARLHGDRRARTQPGGVQVAARGQQPDVAEPVDAGDRRDEPAVPRGAGAAARAARAPPPSSGSPASRSAAPAASRAATGANTSRPWNVADTGSSRKGDREISTASATPPKRSAAGIRSPLSGPDEDPVLLRDPQRHRPPRSADPRIDHRDVHAGRHEGQRAGERQRAAQDVLRAGSRA